MRNTPENYLSTLREHFAHLPQCLSPTHAPLAKPCASNALMTTNQESKGTAFQRWFHFKEAFSPAFVTAAIDSLGFRPDHVIDPFGGSGTTAITAQLMSIDSTTIEVNPFLADVIRAKLSPLSAEHLRQAAADFQANLARTRARPTRLNHLPATFIEGGGKERWIFSSAMARRLAQYLDCIDVIEDENIRRFFRVVLGAVLVDASNVYVNGKGRRYRRGWEESEATPSRLDELFGSQFNTAFEDVLRFQSRPSSKTNVVHGDSRSALSGLKQTSDLIVFSPPYPNSFDYTDIYNVELWVLGYLKSGEDNQQLRTNTLRSHVQIKRDFDLPIESSPLLQNTLQKLKGQEMFLWDRNIPAMVGAYFRDMERILVECRRLLSARGKLMMVVGDSRYSEVTIPVADILAEQAKSLGFGLVKTQRVRQMRSSAQQGGKFQLAESIVELRA